MSSRNALFNTILLYNRNKQIRGLRSTRIIAENTNYSSVEVEIASSYQNLALFRESIFSLLHNRTTFDIIVLVTGHDI